jgi:hypothetical protein
VRESSRQPRPAGRCTWPDRYEGHFQATVGRMPDSSDPVLVLHDTTEFSYKREDTEAIGKTTVTYTGAGKDGRPRLRTVCGLLMHSSLVVTSDGLPLGLAAAKFGRSVRPSWSTPTLPPSRTSFFRTSSFRFEPFLVGNTLSTQLNTGELRGCQIGR